VLDGTTRDHFDISPKLMAEWTAVKQVLGGGVRARGDRSIPVPEPPVLPKSSRGVKGGSRLPVPRSPSAGKPTRPGASASEPPVSLPGNGSIPDHLGAGQRYRERVVAVEPLAERFTGH